MSNTKTPDFWGSCVLRSELSLEEVASILSAKVFAGAKFGGKEESIHEEVPAVFIQEPFMGMLVVLDGYSGMDNNFVLSIQPYGDFDRYLYDREIETENSNHDLYLFHLLSYGLHNYPDIQIEQP